MYIMYKYKSIMRIGVNNNYEYCINNRQESLNRTLNCLSVLTQELKILRKENVTKDKSNAPIFFC